MAAGLRGRGANQVFNLGYDKQSPLREPSREVNQGPAVTSRALSSPRTSGLSRPQWLQTG